MTGTVKQVLLKGAGNLAVQILDYDNSCKCMKPLDPSCEYYYSFKSLSTDKDFKDVPFLRVSTSNRYYAAYDFTCKYASMRTRLFQDNVKYKKLQLDYFTGGWTL